MAVRVPLSEFKPLWIPSIPGRGRRALTFYCPACGNHRWVIFLLRPYNGEIADTSVPERLYREVSGSTFDNLTFRDHLECGHERIYLTAGDFVVG